MYIFSACQIGTSNESEAVLGSLELFRAHLARPRAVGLVTIPRCLSEQQIYQGAATPLSSSYSTSLQQSSPALLSSTTSLLPKLDMEQEKVALQGNFTFTKVRFRKDPQKSTGTQKSCLLYDHEKAATKSTVFWGTIPYA